MIGDHKWVLWSNNESKTGITIEQYQFVEACADKSISTPVLIQIKIELKKFISKEVVELWSLFPMLLESPQAELRIKRYDHYSEMRCSRTVYGAVYSRVIGGSFSCTKQSHSSDGVSDDSVGNPKFELVLKSICNYWFLLPWNLREGINWGLKIQWDYKKPRSFSTLSRFL